MSIIKILVCPYCGDDKTGREYSTGCCGESCAHYEYAYIDEDSGDDCSLAEFESQMTYKDMLSQELSDMRHNQAQDRIMKRNMRERGEK